MNADTVAALGRLRGPDRRAALEWNYRRFNHARFRASDPVAFVWSFHDPADREIAAWTAAALAYGRVASIQAALRGVDRRWEGQPAAFLAQASLQEQRNALAGFVYRWTRAPHLLGHLRGWHILRTTHDLPARFARDAAPGPGGYRRALAGMVRDLREAVEDDPGHLLPNPAGPSACKRPAMWLRWMVRRDEIDPGPWADRLDPAKLWVPLDTHLFRIAKRLRLTRRRTPDGEAARRVTAAFARLCPEDPVRYDFAITRLGMGTPDSSP